MGWRERAGKRFKIFFSPVSAFAGEKKLHCTVQNGTVQFFFFFFEEKEKKFRSDPKMGYDSCPPLYNAYGARTLRNKLVKKTKAKKMI